MCMHERARVQAHARTRTHTHKNNMHIRNPFIHSTGMCRMWRFLAVLRSFFRSSLLCTFSCHPSPPTVRPSSLTLSCPLFLGLPLHLVVLKFIYQKPIQIVILKFLPLHQSHFLHPAYFQDHLYVFALNNPTAGHLNKPHHGMQGIWTDAPLITQFEIIIVFRWK